MLIKERILSVLEDTSLSPEEREARICETLGFEPEPVESRIVSQDPNLYAGLEQEAFSTPFEDYVTILKDMNEAERLADLGAGYGKGTIISQALELGRECLSLEISPERVAYAKDLLARLGLSSDSIQVFDLKVEEPPLAQAYFVYLPLGELIFKPLESLFRKKRGCDFYVIESHGDLLDFFEALPQWFVKEKVLRSQAARHVDGIHKFRFQPQALNSIDRNSPDIIYELVLRWNENPVVTLEKESGLFEAPLQSLLPIKYNGKTALECSAAGRIVDFQNVRIIDL